MTEPYYTDDSVILYHGRAEDVPMPDGAALVTDPPYPNNAGHFTDGILVAEELIRHSTASEAIIFWSELAPPPSALPLVAVHIWHRTNVNGRPYEPDDHTNRPTTTRWMARSDAAKSLHPPPFLPVLGPGAASTWDTPHRNRWRSCSGSSRKWPRPSSSTRSPEADPHWPQPSSPAVWQSGSS
jgi:hypothetical protein